jgi:diguanylate cyclase (GGDEF)-like protein
MLRLAQWTFFGTAGCLVISLAYNFFTFRSFGGEVLAKGLLSATVLPIVLAGPLFFYLTLKLRELAIANHRLRDTASIDSLTGCLNRGAFAAAVELRAGRPGASGALLVVDADHFKRINDRFGHVAGDEALCIIARALTESAREGSIVGRLGGEEFGILLPGIPAGAVQDAAERMRFAVQAAGFAPGEKRWPLSVSIGVAFFDSATSFTELFRVADRRLYMAKMAGRNRVEAVNPGIETQAATILPDRPLIRNA